MEVLATQSNWQKQTQFSHWLKHSLLPLVLILMILWLPKPWLIPIQKLTGTIFEVTLKTDQTEPKTIRKDVIKPTVPPAEPPQTTADKPTPEVQRPTPVPQAVTKQPNQTTLRVPNQTTPEKSIAPVSKVVSSGDILLSAQNRTSVVVPSEFQARTGTEKDFYIPQPEIENWLADIPYLDESVDRPTIQMKFYAEGIEGSIEKFFDKITVSKTFTTKYGTKIHCALIGVIAACGWK